jgi:endoribonuclease Dicer
MASWAQSRGRARRKRSTFTLMFMRGGGDQGNVTKWEKLEEGMVRLYNDNARVLVEEEAVDIADEADNDLEFRVPSTG